MNTCKKPDRPKLVPKEPTFVEMLNDPIVQDLMRSDKVSRRSIELLPKSFVNQSYSRVDYSAGGANAH